MLTKDKDTQYLAELEEKEREEKAAEESKLNKPITYKFLLTFTIPTILSFIFMGVFGAIDGVFAARGISQQAQGAVGYVFPFFTVAMSIGAMLSIGGTALIAKKKGQKLIAEARENFTMLSIATLAISLTIAVISWFARTPILRLLGVPNDPVILGLAMDYIQPLIVMMSFIMLGMFFVQLLIAEGRPLLSMFASTSGAVVSTSLNALFIFVLDLGVMGLALATGIGYSVPTVLGLIYFTINRKKGIYFVRPKWDIRALGRSATNGLSEMVTMLSISVTSIVMNNVLTDIVGWEGVAAAGIAFAAMGITSALFMGYATGVAPVVSFNFGKKKDLEQSGERSTAQRQNLRLLYKKSLVIVGALSVIALVTTFVFSNLLVRIYVSPNDVCCMTDGVITEPCDAHQAVIEYMIADPNVPFNEGDPAFMEMMHYIGFDMCTGDLHPMATRGLRIIALGFILMGFNVFATAWFTAFNDGLVSGFMSLMRTMVFTLILLVTLPRIINPALDGAWLAMPIAEVLAIGITVFFLVKMGRKYHYRKSLPSISAESGE